VKFCKVSQESPFGESITGIWEDLLSFLFADTLTGLTIGAGGATSSSDDIPFKLLKDQ
jgi:hypothetical protein